MKEPKDEEMPYLTVKEVANISVKNNLERAQVYNIRAIFGSMVKLNQQIDPSFNTSNGPDLKFFIRNCTFTMTALPEISIRILQSAGLDTCAKKVTVDWDTFLKLYCIFEVGDIEKQKLIAFWIKFFDLKMENLCHEEVYMDLLEKLVRGVCMDSKSDFTVQFALQFQQKMKDRGVLNACNSIMMDRLHAAFTDNSIDVY